MSRTLHPEKKLSDVCEKITVGHVGKMASSYVDGGIPFLRSQNIKPFQIDLSGVKEIRPSFHSRLRKSELLPGDVAVVRTGYPGTAAVIPNKIRIANCADLVVIRPDDSLDPWFLSAVFNSALGKGRVSGQLVGVAQQHFNVSSAKEMKIPFPALSTQRMIGAIMRVFTKLIENNTRRIAILEETAQAVYREWFVNLKFPGHEKAKFVESELGNIPEGWSASTIGSCSTVIPGYAFKSKDWENSGVPVVKIKNITNDNCVDLESADCVSESLVTPRLKKFVLENRDLLIAMTGATAGKAGVLRTRAQTVLNQRVAKIAPREGFRSLLWCFTIGNRELFYNLADGAAQPNMSGGQIESVPLLVPSVPVLSMFESRMDKVAGLADCLFFKNRNLKATRDLLLPKLISGQLDVADLDIDTGLADELLEATA